MIDTVLHDRHDRAQRDQIHVYAALESAPIVGDGHLVEQLVANLVDNALRYNHPGGHLHISTETRGGDAVLSIANTGAVVPSDAVDLLFQPFRRLGAGRTSHGDGHGLGLSIVKAITDAHHGVVTARIQPDGGLHVMIALPAGRTARLSAQERR